MSKLQDARNRLQILKWLDARRGDPNQCLPPRSDTLRRLLAEHPRIRIAEWEKSLGQLDDEGAIEIQEFTNILHFNYARDLYGHWGSPIKDESMNDWPTLLHAASITSPPQRTRLRARKTPDSKGRRFERVATDMLEYYVHHLGRLGLAIPEDRLGLFSPRIQITRRGRLLLNSGEGELRSPPKRAKARKKRTSRTEPTKMMMEAYDLHITDGLSLREIEEKIGKSHETVRQWILLVKKYLRIGRSVRTRALPTDNRGQVHVEDECE